MPRRWQSFFNGVILGSFLLGIAIECIGQISLEQTPLRTCYAVDLGFRPVIQRQLEALRKDIRKRHSDGKFIAYLSTPLTSRGGGDMEINKEISEFVKKRFEDQFGGKLWVLDPAEVELTPLQLRSGKPKPAGGAEYMLLWTDLLAGEDGMGKDFDMFIVTGPNDIRAFFNQRRKDDATMPNLPPTPSMNLLGMIDDWISRRADADADFRKRVAEDPNRREQFLSFYGMKASGSFSAGSHDEWNAFVEINRKRRQSEVERIPEQIPVYFDGRALSAVEMEINVSSGYALRCPPVE